VGEQMNVADQVKPPDASGYRKHGEAPPKRASRRPQRTLPALVAALLVTWIAVGLYGAFSYGKAYDTYRGFPPPVDPVGVAPGHLYREKFYSTALGRDRTFRVYTPPGYRAGAARGARYPVLYLLHGAPGNPKRFINVAAAGVTLDTEVNHHVVRPYILVMPNGEDGTFRSDTEWANTPHGKYESLVLETMRVADERFATLRGRRFRAIGGYSEGGYAAVNIALHHPRLFSIAESWSGYGLENPVGPFAHATFAQRYANSPTLYAPTLRSQLRRWPLYAYLYSGREDHGMRYQRRAAVALFRGGAHVRFEVFPGKHDWALWRGQTPRMIRWAGRMFGWRRAAKP
jgi:enterochelin esterase-like enzyme